MMSLKRILNPSEEIELCVAKKPRSVTPSILDHVREDGVIHIILGFLDVKGLARAREVCPKWKGFIKTLHLEKLDISAEFIHPTKLSMALPSIMTCFGRVETVNCTGQSLLYNQDLLIVTSRYWSSLQHIVLDNCIQITDQAIHAILDSSSTELKSMSMVNCKQIRGRFSATALRGVLPNLEKLDFRHTCMYLSGIRMIEKCFTSLGEINAIHTPAHHEFLVQNSCQDLLVNLSSICAYDDDKPDKLLAMYQDLRERHGNMHISSAFEKCLMGSGMAALVEAPLDIDELSTALMLACEDGNCKTGQMLIETGHADVNATDRDNSNAIYVAATYGKQSTISMLLKFHANAQQSTIYGGTPIYIACELGHTGVLKLLLQHSIKCQERVVGGESSLFIAAKNGYVGIIQTLIASKEFLRISDKDLQTAMFMAIEHGKYRTVEYFLKKGISATATISGNVSPVYVASQVGRVDIVRLLVAHGSDVNTRRTNGVSPLYIASQEGHYAVVAELLANGADLNAQMRDMATAIHIAVRMGHIDVFTELLAHGANINKKTRCGLTPLFIAAQEGHNEIAQILIELGADIECQIFDGATPLFIASQNGHLEIVRALLKHKANPEIAKDNGARALHVAAQMGQNGVVSALLEAGATVNAYTVTGGSPIHFANQCGHFGLVQLLMKKSGEAPSSSRNSIKPKEETTGKRLENQLNTSSL